MKKPDIRYRYQQSENVSGNGSSSTRLSRAVRTFVTGAATHL